MELLWKKESTKDNALYRDLFVNITNDFQEHWMYDLTGVHIGIVEKLMTKKNAFSFANRKDGNEKFISGKWEEAMQKYNGSLRYAENNTEDVALAYANRSACFFKLKMYGKCLIDIELATNASYPDRLKLKLEKRKSDCLELLHEDVVTENLDAVKLSYEANKCFPFMANILEIKNNDEFGRHIVTKCDIPAGKTVLIEDNFITHIKANNSYTDTGEPIRCITCNKITSNPIPCVKCTVVMFCNSECMHQNKIHKIDCGALYHLSDDMNSKYIIQSIVAAVNMFPTVESLMDFVKDAITGEKYEIPTSVLNQQSKYRMFLKLYSPSNMENFIAETYKAYQTILRLEEIQKLFDSTLKKRFLMQLVGHHLLIFLYNSFDGQMCVFISLFSHSCIPNIQEIWIDNRTACITIRPIKKGEQLYLCYMNEEVMKCRQKDHKVELYRKYGFRCKCAKCENQLVDSKKIERDIRFRQIDNIGIDPNNKVLLRDLSQKCIKLLNKYDNLSWSHQLDYVSKKLGLSLGMFHELQNRLIL